MIVDKETSIEY